MAHMKYIPHSDMCGCDRCAREYERDHPQQVFDEVPMTPEEELQAHSDDVYWDSLGDDYD